MNRLSPSKRFAAIKRYQILDTLSEQAYDDITLLAAQICDTPMAVLNFLAEDRQWTKSQVGIGPERNTPLENSFCIHTVQQAAPIMLVPDAWEDARFANNPSVIGDPYIRFYAGAQLITPAGTPIGAICVIDRMPHTLSEAQIKALEALARQVVGHLELRRTASALYASEQRFQVFMDHSPAVAFLKDAAKRYVYVNQSFAKCFGRDRTAVLGKRDDEVWPAALAERIQALDTQVRAGDTSHTLEETTDGADGQMNTWQMTIFPIPFGDERWLGGIAIDITAQKAHSQRLEATQRQLEDAMQDLTQTSRTDPLTGVANRRALDNALADASLLALNTDSALALIMLDVDRFKHYNDTYGHAAGDCVLKQVARILQSSARGTDMVARYGGEEFVIVLPNTTLEHAWQIAERCRQAIAVEPCADATVTISGGIAAQRGAEIDVQRLLAAADAALYQAKQGGRNQMVVAVADDLVAPTQREINR